MVGTKLVAKIDRGLRYQKVGEIRHSDVWPGTKALARDASSGAKKGN